MASGHEVPKPDTANHPGRRVHREVFDNTTVRDPATGNTVPRRYVSRYDEQGNFISQGYTQ